MNWSGRLKRPPGLPDVQGGSERAENLNLYACIGVPEAEDERLTLDSVRFHTRMGFAKCGEFCQRGRESGRWYHMIWMEKIIGGHGK